ncbi:unnamed protein product [Phytophthora fragariaefolia]|uniref:Unnamed protein product n=1 Tax=Phytophthora fragariaefolia TaxID=1490495 RepID=A0A9W6Y6X4_9STRA|nr:unnamed protein product [Phytophthora fragariaefolia]
MTTRGGRPPGQEARHFRLLKELGKAPGGYSYRECKFCRAAYNSDVTPTTPKGVIVRTRNYVSHLAKCTHYQALQLPQASPCDPSLSTEAEATTQEANTAFILDLSPINTSEFVVAQSLNKSRARRALVLEKGSVVSSKRSIIEMHADNHLPDRLIERDSVLRFLELLVPGITDILPSRRTLGSRILKEHVARCKAIETNDLKTIQDSTNGWINILSDVWQNICKEHLLGCQLSLFGALLTYALLPAGDEHHGVAIAAQLEKLLEQVLQDQWQVGAIVSDNAGQCGLKTVNASSSKWLPRARKMMVKFYGRHLGLRTLCETRWNSMQGCFASLLRVQSAVQMFYRKYKSDIEFPLTLRVFGDSFFWEELNEAEAVIEPLSFASHRLRRDENTVADVVISFHDIYRGFHQHLVRHDNLVSCIENRWTQCEQPLFMLGFALHPVYVDTARGLPDTPISGTGSLCKIAVYYYRRLFSTEKIGEIRRDMLNWMKGRFTLIKASEFPRCPWQYWECVASENPSSALPKLAIRLISIAVNTATCERLFNELGLIHTPKRNRMAASKTLDFHTKLLISPVEREIIFDTANASGTFSPSPQPRGSARVDEDSDNEDPGDGVEGEPTLSLWGDFLDEVFQDTEIESGYTATDNNTPAACLPAPTSANGGEPPRYSSNEVEVIADMVKTSFPDHNDRNFPQETVTLQGFRGQKARLAELFQ